MTQFTGSHDTTDVTNTLVDELLAYIYGKDNDNRTLVRQDLEPIA